MNLFSALIEAQSGPTSEGRVYGLVVAVVTNNQDPDGLGRVRLRFPWLNDAEESHWARIAAPMAGKKMGFYCLPEVDDEVLVGFEHGDLRMPYVLGALWNGKDGPPADNSDGKNNHRLLQSRSGHVIRLNDEDGKETIEIIDSSGKNSLTIDTAAKTITIQSDQDIALVASNGSISLEAKDITLKSSGDTKLESGAGLDIKASGTLNVKGSTINLN
jgi:uncharacterized protein involved in type VI secretion and phage assembly